MKAYILNITFNELQPAVTRQVILPAGATFNRLHETIQTVTNFTDSHLYQFEFEQLIVTNDSERVDEAKRKSYKGKPVKSPTRLKIDAYMEAGQTFSYLYDFGDYWTLTITVEKIVEDYYFGFPTLLAGQGTAPADDVGGVEGFKEFLTAYNDETHADHKNMREWASHQSFKEYDEALINEMLKQVKYGKTQWEHIQHDNYTVLEDPYRGPKATAPVAEEKAASVSEAPKEAVVTQQTTTLPEALQYVKAAVNLYGIISVRDFLRLYEMHHAHEQLHVKELQAILLDANNVALLKDNQVVVYNDVFVHEALDRAENSQAFVRRTFKKSFYIPVYSEFMRYADASYVEATPYQQKLTTMLAHDFYEGNEALAHDKVLELVVRLQGVDANFNTFINDFLTAHMPAQKERMNDYLQVISDVAVTTRLWENRGYTTKELQAKNAPQKAIQQKVGRNDDCPCGSGKKYKKCCGK